MSVFSDGKRRQLAAADDVRLDEQPRRVTDRGHGLAGFEERADELDGVAVLAQVVGIADASRQNEAVVIVDASRRTPMNAIFFPLSFCSTTESPVLVCKGDSRPGQAQTAGTRGAPGRIRTCDPRLRRPPLCPLSYRRPHRA
jgi:hypothetical protein